MCSYWRICVSIVGFYSNSLKIFNKIKPLTIEDIKTESNIISILEIQGIKFTSRNFQIEIELKQAMALNCEPVFNSCLIKKDKKMVFDK